MTVERGISAFHRAKTHCPHGHPYDAENTYISPLGHRFCRQCKRDEKARRKAKDPEPFLQRKRESNERYRQKKKSLRAEN